MSEERKGEWFVYLSGILWAFFPVVTVLTYHSIGSAASLLWTDVFATIFFAGLIVYRGKLAELRSALLWKYGFLAALFIGVLYYSLIFIGLEFTSPGNVAIISLFEVFTTFLVFNVYEKEFFSSGHTVGAVLMLIGAGIVLVRDFSGLNIGDLFVLAAVLFSPWGNVFQQRARDFASSESIMFIRSLLSIPALGVLAYTLGPNISFEDFRVSLPFLLVNGVLLFGLSKFFWIEAIHRISVTKGVALSSVTPFLTLMIAWAVLGQVPNIWQLASLVPLTIGVLLLTDHLKRTGLKLL
ncbi:MAG: DMT family transporter [bacterium]|nr:DMT family transporter [bacterium]